MSQIAIPLALGLIALVFAGLYVRLRLRLTGRAIEGADSDFAGLIENAPAGIWRANATGECVYVNDAWKRMAGVENDSWKGHGWGDFIHPDDRDRILSIWITAVANHEEVREELRWQRDDGSDAWTLCHGSPEFGADGELIGYTGINFDIQRSKDLEQDLQAARRRAENEARSKSTFLANMSHEIRTPMNGVIGFTELLLDSELTESQFTQVNMIAESGHAMMQLLNDILDHSRIEAGQLEISTEPVDLRHKLQHCAKLIEPMARAKGLSVGIWIDDAVPQLLELDPLRVRQVVLNLVGNAVKFTHTGGIDIEARVENSSEGQSLLIAVIDTGIGIEDDRLEDIFTPFTQEDGSVARRYGGTGLGLAICSQLVEMMGGHITVHSKRNVGTQFTVRLPMKAAAERRARTRSESDELPDGSSRLAGTRILIAEDHAINQQLVIAMANSLELDVQLVENGEEAIDAVIAADEKGRPFAAILMDMQMPDVDGLEATRRLRALGFNAEKLPIIALTANCYPDDVAACQKAGMQSHLGKPVTTVALARELSRWLAPNGGIADRNAPPAMLERNSATLVSSPPPSLAGLEDRYRDRRDTILHKLRESMAQAPSDTDWKRLADELHKLAGVAANFGEPELGEASRRLERWLKTSDQPDQMIEALKREWPNFEKAA
ncbi:PAS domain-containing hybrid sensor histidine kinase/response regulator [Aurantiacibacter sp. MUD61]|uniref:PAS domain-containing hybrid sensor histidine kinase/response regulator n=1 Tax=Aurantiacibacter sp. MUD61 TaxID=3009083 RepID=UPI0022F10B8E|nr:ATP-binding protein [Aurantiacibacter sp. MUD61]